MRKRDAKWWRDYRRRRREKAARAVQPPTQLRAEHHNPATGLRTPVASPATTPTIVAQPQSPRRVRVKSDKEIRAEIADVIRSYAHKPSAMLHVLVGVVAQIQEDVKRDTEDVFASRACEKHHPGRPAQGVYCRLCHDAQMAGRYGKLPPGSKGAKPAEAELEEEDELSDLDDVQIGKLEE